MKRWIRGTNALVLTAAVIGIFIVVTIFLGSLRGLQFDLTADKKNTLSQITLDTLRNLDQNVQIYAFTGAYSYEDVMLNEQIVGLLKEYERRSNRVTFDEIDPAKRPTLAEQYEVDQFNTIVFVSGDQTKKVFSYQLFAPGMYQGSFEFNGEEKFTQAILDITGGERKMVYFLTGHGELSAYQLGAFRSALFNEGYDSGELNLLTENGVPEDAEMVLVIGPESDLNAREKELLASYIDGGGSLFFALRHSTQMAEWQHFDDILGMLGITNHKAVIIDPQRNLYGNPNIIIPMYRFHTIVNRLEEFNRVVLFPDSIAISGDQEHPVFRHFELMRSTDRSYTKLYAELQANRWAQAEGDLSGPFAIAYAIEDMNRNPRAVVVSNALFLRDDILFEQGNRDFALNSIGWLSRQENLISIRPREESFMATAFIMPNEVNRIFYGTVAGLPLFFLLVGGIVWWRRRKG